MSAPKSKKAKKKLRAAAEQGAATDVSAASASARSASASDAAALSEPAGGSAPLIEGARKQAKSQKTLEEAKKRITELAALANESKRKRKRAEELASKELQTRGEPESGSKLSETRPVLPRGAALPRTSRFPTEADDTDATLSAPFT